MGRINCGVSDRVVATVADALGRDPLQLPALGETVDADALDELFHGDGRPQGAHTVFPYCDLWVVVHSTGTVDVFEEYRATTADDQLPGRDPEPTTDDRLVVLHFRDQRYTFHDDQIDRLHEIVSGSADTDEAWDRAIEFAHVQAAE